MTEISRKIAESGGAVGYSTTSAGEETEAVDHPSHYTSHPSGVEAITITEGFNFNIGNAIKYCWRAGLKSLDPIEDLKKAAWYVNREISRLEKKCSST